MVPSLMFLSFDPATFAGGCPIPEIVSPHTVKGEAFTQSENARLPNH